MTVKHKVQGYIIGNITQHRMSIFRGKQQEGPSYDSARSQWQSTKGAICTGMDRQPNSRKQRQSSAEKYDLLGKEATQVWATQTDVKQIVWHRNRYQVSL